MENNGKPHIVSYKTYALVLLALIILTGISVAITSIDLGTLTVTGALLLASVKTVLVLLIFMHLKFDSKILTIMFLFILFSIVSIIIITFLDYLYR
jgi:cytochrome c oxidase subunit IV